MSENKKDNKNKTLKTIIIILLTITFLCGIIFSIYYFYCRSNNSENSLENIIIDTNQVEDNKTERMLQLEELQKENSDIIGYLKIEDTNINYPVLQTDNNDYYLTRNYKKEKASGGSLFLDKDFDLNKPSSNYLIYGHRMKNGTMFEDLIKYANEEFYKAHPTIKFTTNNEECEYEIIGAFYSRVYYKDETNVFRYYYFIDAKNEQEYNNYIDNVKKASIYDTEKTAEYGEQLLTLSTCEYSQEDGRFVVVARKAK